MRSKQNIVKVSARPILEATLCGTLNRDLNVSKTGLVTYADKNQTT